MEAASGPPPSPFPFLSERRRRPERTAKRHEERDRSSHSRRRFSRIQPHARARPGARQGPGSDRPSVRLIIEEDRDTGDFIYKTLDRSTGEVILQLPRKEVMKSVASGEYSAGDVFKARA
jgi:flagellar protein FlaG